MGRDEDIKTRAYQIWEEEGQPDGRHDDHWKRAEDELSVPQNSGEVGGMMGGQQLDTPPEVNSGSVKASSSDAPAKSRKG